MDSEGVGYRLCGNREGVGGSEETGRIAVIVRVTLHYFCSTLLFR